MNVYICMFFTICILYTYTYVTCVYRQHTQIRIYFVFVPGNVSAVAFLGAGVRPLRVQTAQRVIITKRSLHANPKRSHNLLNQFFSSRLGQNYKSGSQPGHRNVQSQRQSGQGNAAKTKRAAPHRAPKAQHDQL